MTLAPPLITALTCGVLMLLQMALLLTVAIQRGRARQSLGDGENPGLLRAIRRHGNLAENAAIFIAGFALLEMLGASRTSMIWLCALFVLARISHAIGLSLRKTVNPGRFIGAVMTVLIGVVVGVRLLVLAFGAL